MSQNQNSQDFAQELDKAYKLYLIKRIDIANYYIYTVGDEATGLNVLDGIIDSTDESFQKALKPIHDQIKGAIYKHAPHNARDIFAKLTTFLLKTYLTDVGFATIPTAALQCTSEAPSEKIPSRLKAGI